MGFGGKGSKVAHLGEVPLFTACNKKELGLIASAAREMAVSEGTVLCQQGEPGSDFYLVLSGEAVVRRNGRKVATIEAGGSFGELALLSRIPRNATVEA